MKKILCLFTLAALALSFSSCCSMFGGGKSWSGTRTETKQVKVVTNNGPQVYIAPDAKTGIGGMMEGGETVSYKTVSKEVRIPCQKCTRYYCPKKDCCGTTSESVMKMATSQGSTGSPHIGLIPTMRKLAE
ncbi:hypothetical protein [Luteolibacter sp. AS25]|uniref:hypothetical protein n=1 Tax=Luteolibacter sp. AS25 TaxID=3135776 RepID=UPI00398B9870